MEDIILDEIELLQRLKVWQERLRLQDWDIEASIRRASEMEGEVVGSVSWSLSRKQASISILDQNDYPDDRMGYRDMENDLIHELIHIHLAPIHEHFGSLGNGEMNPMYTMFEEQAIESLTSALLSERDKNSTGHQINMLKEYKGPI